MRAFVLHGKEDLRPAELPRPEPAAGQVLLRVRRVGICGSDVHYFTHGRVGAFVPKRPFALGHEFAGEVVAVGAGVTAPQVGRRVTVDPSQPCGGCRHCREGRYNLCENMRYFGSASCDPHLDGGFAEFVVVPARNCFELPPGMSWAEAAMLEPLSVALHAAVRAGALPGRSVLVTGGGAIGQLCALAARTFGATRLVLADVLAGPRDFALQMGVDAVLDAGAAEVCAQALASSDGGFDVVIEAAGSPAALTLALQVARRGGTIVQVGTLANDVSLPANLIMAKELTVAGSFRFAHVFPMALELVASKRIDVAALVSATYPFADTLAAMHRAVRKDGVVKVQIEHDGA